MKIEHAQAGPISHDEADQILGRFNASHWHHTNPSPHEVARYSIPANPDRDDDIRLGAYIAQQRAKDVELTAAREDAYGSERAYLTTLHKVRDLELKAFWRGVCGGIAASFDGFARDFERENPCDWRIDGCEQIASNMRRYAAALARAARS